MTNPAFVSINGTPLSTSGITGFNATSGETITITITNPANVSSWTLAATNYDGYNSLFQPSLVNNNLSRVNLTTYDLTVPTLNSNIGGGNIFTSTVNNGQAVFTFGIWVLGTNGLRAFIGGEDIESNITVGVAYDLNALVANVGAGSTSAFPTGPAGGGLNGTYPSPGVNPLTMSGDVTGTTASNVLSKIDGYTLPSPTTGALTESGGTLSWVPVPTSLPPNGSASGDLSGTYPSPTVAKIQGIAVNNGSVSDGYILQYNAGQAKFLEQFYNRQVIQFLTSGTWVCPAGITSVIVYAAAGGNSGGSSGITNNGSGGGGSQLLSGFISTTPGLTYTITVGAGGIGPSGTSTSSGTASVDGYATTIALSSTVLLSANPNLSSSSSPLSFGSFSNGSSGTGARPGTGGFFGFGGSGANGGNQNGSGAGGQGSNASANTGAGGGGGGAGTTTGGAGGNGGSGVLYLIY